MERGVTTDNRPNDEAPGARGCCPGAHRGHQVIVTSQQAYRIAKQAHPSDDVYMVKPERKPKGPA